MTYGDYPNLTGVKKVLVVKLRQLGDVLLTGPVFFALKTQLPGAVVDAYVYSDSIPLLQGHPAIHGVLGYDRAWKSLSWRKRLAREWALLWQIRKNRYDLVINLTEGDRGAIAAKISGAPIRVGMAPKGRFKNKLYTHVVKSCSTLRHTVERNLDALRRIGIFPAWGDRELYFPPPPEIVLPPNPYILIHPTSRWKFKCLPVATMRALVIFLLSRGISLDFTSGPDPEEREMVRQICQDFPVLDLAGKISLNELGAWILHSEQLICVDSLQLHIASALKKPATAEFGPTSDVTWGPWRNPHARIVAQNFSCRPCYQDGCGGSKVSDCLATLHVEIILKTLDKREDLVSIPQTIC